MGGRHQQTGLVTIPDEECLEDVKYLDWKDKTFGRCVRCLQIVAACQIDKLWDLFQLIAGVRAGTLGEITERYVGTMQGTPSD